MNSKIWKKTINRIWLTSVFLVLLLQSTFASTRALYTDIGLADKLSYDIFELAMRGYERIPDKRQGIITIIDYTKPSHDKRLYVIDLAHKTIKYETLVSHAKNSGLLLPVQFSNNPNSFQSSLGFYLTGAAYNGDYGYSVRLDGLEPWFNSNARRRAIVIHGADYVSEDYLKKNGFLGRTSGCPAVPLDMIEPIVNFIKDKTVVFVIGNDNKYLERSQLLN